MEKLIHYIIQFLARWRSPSSITPKIIRWWPTSINKTLNRFGFFFTSITSHFSIVNCWNSKWFSKIAKVPYERPSSRNQKAAASNIETAIKWLAQICFEAWGEILKINKIIIYFKIPDGGLGLAASLDPIRPNSVSASEPRSSFLTSSASGDSYGDSSADSIDEPAPEGLSAQ